MVRKKKFNTKYSPEFKLSVILDMRESHLAYRETVRKHWNTQSRTEEDLYVNTVKKWERIYLEEGATRASVAGFRLTTGAAFGISVGATTLAGMAKYSLNCVASDENHWSCGGFVLSGVEEALQGAATFCLAFVGGKTGLFNKLGNFSSPDVFFTKFGGMNTMRAIVWSSKVLIGETLSKALFVSGSAALARWLIDLMIPNLY